MAYEAMDSRSLLSVYTPSRTAPEDLEAIHVQRHAMLEDAVERVRESATTGNKHHLLFVGPRGTGKTHLVTLLVHRLSRDQDLNEHLRIAWLNEDETSTKLVELLRRIYDALAKRYPDEYPLSTLEPVFDLGPNDAERRLATLLLEKLGTRTLLVVVENLDALFEGLGTPGQQKLRAFIQEHAVVTLVATAQRLVDDVTKRKSAFFGFFQTEQLKTLSIEDATELLQKIAGLSKQPELAAFLTTATGRARMRALHHLSGGNHRIYIILSQFITRDSVDSLVDPFAKMVDEMTPYYQERIRWLPAQQRNIVEYLCTCERPTPVKDIARRLFASHQTISGQLGNLREKGYVIANQRGRESLYEIAEPLMRICVEVKENQSSGPLRILVDFLRVWYDNRELTTRLLASQRASSTRSYLEDAVAKNKASGNLRTELLMRGIRASLGEARVVEWDDHIEEYVGDSDELALACSEWAEGNDESAFAIIEDMVNGDGGQSPGAKASALLLAAEILKQRGELESAIARLSSVMGLSNVPVDQVAAALIDRGLLFGESGDSDKEIDDYSAVIDLPEAPVDQVAKALLYRGITFGQRGDSDKEIDDYSAVIDLPEAPVDQVAKALLNRGITFGQRGDSDKEVADYGAVIDLPEAPVDQVARALLSRGITFGQRGDSDKEVADYGAVIDLPEAPVDQVARALVSRGIRCGQRGDSDKAIADYNAVIDSPQTPVERVADGLYIRGLTYKESGDSDKAIADFSAVIDMPGAPIERVAAGLYIRGLTYKESGDSDKAIADFSTVIDMPGAPIEQVAEALVERGVTYGRRGDIEKEIADYSAAIELPQAPVEEIVRALFNRREAYEKQANSEGEIADLSAIIGFRESSAEQVGTALLFRGVKYFLRGDVGSAIADFSSIVEMHQLPAEILSWALALRGAAYGWCGNTGREIADYGSVIDADQAPVESLAYALQYRAVIYVKRGEADKAITDSSAVIDHPQAVVKRVAEALIVRSTAYWQKGDAASSKRDINSAFSLEGATAEIRVDCYLLLAEIRIATGSWDAGLVALAEGLKEGNRQAKRHVGDSIDIVAAFFESGAMPGVLQERARRLAGIYRDNDAVPELGEGLTKHLGYLHARTKNRPVGDTLDTWAATWESAGKEIAELRMPLRLLRTGIDFVKSGGQDRSVLLTLNQEERRILEQTFGLESIS